MNEPARAKHGEKYQAARGFLLENPTPTEAAVKEALCGNLCRCGTYMGIPKAVAEAGRNMKGGTNG